MKLEEILSIQISQIPNFKGLNKELTGENIFEYYKQSHKHVDLDSYMQPRFLNVIKKIS